MSGWLRRLAPTAVVALVAALLTVAWPRAETLPVVATFEDVRDLVPRAQVRVADVPVGTVTGIALTRDHRAEVTMRIAPDTGLPERVEAVLRSTSVLGERYVELRPVDGATGRFAGGAAVRTRSVEDVEDLVATGSELLAVVAADRLAQALEFGATAFVDRGDRVGTSIGDLQGTVAAYAAGRGELVRLIDSTDRLLADLAPGARASAAVLDDLDRAARAFDRQDEDLFAALASLSRLADVGAAILSENADSIAALLARLHGVAAELTRIDGALESLLTWLPRHNLHVANGSIDEQSQVWNDFTVCGVDDEPDNPANSCHPPNPGRSNDPPPGYETDACDRRHEECPYPEGARPGGSHAGPRTGEEGR